MLQIYEHGLLRSAEKMFGANNKDWILQVDNGPKHRSHLCTSWKVENGITTLDWPSQSSDANPIENVWSVVKRKLAGRRAFTLKQLSRRIKEVWSSLPTEYAEKLVESMPRRCTVVPKNKNEVFFKTFRVNAYLFLWNRLQLFYACQIIRFVKPSKIPFCFSFNFFVRFKTPTIQPSLEVWEQIIVAGLMAISKSSTVLAINRVSKLLNIVGKSISSKKEDYVEK